jgi:formate dehydrogenase major subunit
VPEDILREINRSRLDDWLHRPKPRAAEGPHAQHAPFDVKTLKAKGGVDKETGYDFTGDYFGLPWPCYGTPELKHPGIPQPCTTPPNT